MVFGIAAVCSATVRYVSTAGNDANNGASWGGAKKTLQAAINVSGVNDEIWVAQGTYTASAGVQVGYVNGSTHNGLQIYGGFAGNETSRDQRNPDPSATVLHGNRTDNSNGMPVLEFYNIGHIVIDGFTIENGLGRLFGGVPPYSYPSRLGGGIFMPGCWAITINNNIIRNNKATYAYLATYPFCSFGGGVCASYSGTNTERSYFTNNRVEQNTSNGGGGGVSWGVSNTEMSNNSFLANDASYTGSGISKAWAGGGGLYAGGTDVNIDCNTFQSNTASAGGESSAFGGALYRPALRTSIYRNEFIENSVSGTGTSGRGGAIYIVCGIVANNVFLRNSSSHEGGAIYFVSNAGTYTAMITSDTFQDNYSAINAGRSVSVCFDSTCTLKNNIFYYSQDDTSYRWEVYGAASPSGYSYNGARITVDHNCFYHPNTPPSLGQYCYASAPYPDYRNAIITDNGGEVFADPLLTGYRLSANSPCLSVGDPSEMLSLHNLGLLPISDCDYFGNFRFYETHDESGYHYQIDIGAHQYNSQDVP